MSWTKPINCDADMSSLDAGGNEGTITPSSLHHASDARQIVRLAVMDRAATSRTIAQRIQSVMQHSVSARTTRRRFQKI
ncbi:hypothetical protein TNCV_1971651 [Trichonephila clavipes]|uniref:Transposase Tc1-like domain-containing protein n=1 Tax=Trichonephila clavipes TaxID=2585209 RepID=A0A8X6W5R5_TRICX|nr:hypothetical protein TNCV_1971651 [Trichonephila clavipes]